ncbi:hypothetical protein Syun_025756 [Stephania yunnanensis]|uniref:Large ribosomal subunit protein bL12 C-terminal domain-containing protein n=1 Tax=Stephania yunnanensis TaxID=152371 RepID=A0AAP0ET09_9MAGN
MSGVGVDFMVFPLNIVAANYSATYRIAPMRILKRSKLAPHLLHCYLTTKSLHRPLSTTTETQSQKLDRITTELLHLTKLERHDYAILFHLKMGLNNYGPAISGLDSSDSSSAAAGGAAVESKAAEKTTFDLKLEKFDAAVKIKIIKEVRSFTDLGLKEAKELVEKRTNRTKRTNRKPCLVEMEICDLVKVLC